MQFADLAGGSPFELAAVFKIWQELTPEQRREIEKLANARAAARKALRARSRAEDLPRDPPGRLSPGGMDPQGGGQDPRAPRDRPGAQGGHRQGRRRRRATGQGQAGRQDQGASADAPPPGDQPLLPGATAPDPVRPSGSTRSSPPCRPGSGPRSIPIPPDEARRRLTLVYRLVFPHPAGVPARGAPPRDKRARPRRATSRAASPRPATAPPPPVRRRQTPSRRPSRLPRAPPRRLTDRPSKSGTGRTSRDRSRAWLDDDGPRRGEKGQGLVEPNPMVGAVIVRDGQVVGRGHHARFGGPHAEVMALREARRGRPGSDPLRDAGALLPPRQDPPLHRRHPCAGWPASSSRSAIRFPGWTAAAWRSSARRGFRSSSVCGPRRRRGLNAPFLKRDRHRASLRHGQVGHDPRRQDRRGLGGQPVDLLARSRALVHQLRGRMDAILVGIGTVLADDPLLTARPPGPRTPVRIVLDSQARLPSAEPPGHGPPGTSPCSSPSPSRPRSTAALPCEEQGCEVVVFPGRRHVPVTTC